MLPVKKTSKTRTRTRRSHHRIKGTNYSLCQQCGESKLPHAACGNCGFVREDLKLDIQTEESN